MPQFTLKDKNGVEAFKQELSQIFTRYFTEEDVVGVKVLVAGTSGGTNHRPCVVELTCTDDLDRFEDAVFRHTMRKHLGIV